MSDCNWFLDSGAAHHVASDDHSLETKFDYFGYGKLTLGEVSQLPILGIGHLNLAVPLKLRDILLVLSITKSLLSISKIALENDVIVEFNSACCLVKDKHTKAIFLRGVLENRLYHLKIPPDSRITKFEDHFNNQLERVSGMVHHSVLAPLNL